jgi:hypothetical protein
VKTEPALVKEIMIELLEELRDGTLTPSSEIQVRRNPSTNLIMDWEYSEADLAQLLSDDDDERHFDELISDEPEESMRDHEGYQFYLQNKAAFAPSTVIAALLELIQNLDLR